MEAAPETARPGDRSVQSKERHSPTTNELIRQMEALERSVSLTISWQEDLLDRLHKWRTTLGRMVDALRDAEGVEVRPSAQQVAETVGPRFALPPLLKCLFSVLEPGAWCDVAPLSEAVFKATGRQITRHALTQGIHRLRRALALAGKTWCIEHNRRLGWRVVKAGRKSADT